MAFAAAIYINFFAHHFRPDIRIALFAFSLMLYTRTQVSTHRWQMPLPVAACLSAVALWVAKNIGTATGTWLYSGQAVDHWVSFAKLGWWYLLLYVAFVTVTLVSREAIAAPATTPRPATAPTPPAG